MPRLYRVVYEYLGEIGEEQLGKLIDALEEEDESDQDYFIDADTLTYLADAGIDPSVLAMLRAAVGEEGVEISWETDEEADE